MNRIIGGTIGIALAVGIARPAAAQWNAARFETGRNTMYSSFGLDPALVGTVGYGRVVRVAGHPFQLTGDVGLAAAHLDTHDFRARIGTQTTLLTAGAMRLTGSATFITRGTENTLYRALDFGSDFTATLGAYRHGWFAAGEFGFDKAIITHLTHSAWYRDHYYAAAKDGWYLNAGGVFHYGVTTGLSLGRMELSLRAGWRKTENFKDLVSPVYGGVGVGFGF